LAVEEIPAQTTRWRDCNGSAERQGCAQLIASSGFAEIEDSLDRLLGVSGQQRAVFGPRE